MKDDLGPFVDAMVHASTEACGLSIQAALFKWEIALGIVRGISNVLHR